MNWTTLEQLVATHGSETTKKELAHMRGDYEHLLKLKLTQEHLQRRDAELRDAEAEVKRAAEVALKEAVKNELVQQEINLVREHNVDLCAILGITKQPMKTIEDHMINNTCQRCGLSRRHCRC